MFAVDHLSHAELSGRSPAASLPPVKAGSGSGASVSRKPLTAVFGGLRASAATRYLWA